MHVCIRLSWPNLFVDPGGHGGKVMSGLLDVDSKRNFTQHWKFELVFGNDGQQETIKQ